MSMEKFKMRDAKNFHPSGFYINRIELLSISLLGNSSGFILKKFCCLCIFWLSKNYQWQMATRRRLKSPLHSSFRASFRDTSYFSRYMSLMVSKSYCWRENLKQINWNPFMLRNFRSLHTDTSEVWLKLPFPHKSKNKTSRRHHLVT